MALTNPRIIVVDDNQGVYNIVRASLELLGRRPRLIETQSGDDAMTELRISSADLLVTAHSLSGTTNGPMLALMAKRELAALPVIVLGGESDPEIDQDTLEQSPFQYLRRPLAPELFIRALRVALDGPEAVPQENKPEDMMQPVPIVDVDRLRPTLFQLMRDVGAMAVVLADRNGKVVAYDGAAGYIDRDLLAATLGPGFGYTSRILSIIGEQPRVLKYFDGDKLDVFGLAIGLHYFVTLIFDQKAASTLGNVKRFGGTAVNAMLDMIGSETAFGLKPPVQAVEEAPAKEEKAPKEAAPTHGKKTRRTQEMAAVASSKTESKTDGKAGKKKSTSETQAAKQPMMEPIANFDPDLLNALDQVDLSMAEDMFSPDKLASDVSSGGNKISFEDALLQGIIGDVEE